MLTFVTGATGFVGINLVHELEKHGAEIVALKRATSPTKEIETIKNLRFAQGDILDGESMMAAIPEGIDVLFHVAGAVGFLEPEKGAAQTSVNEVGTQNVLRAAKAKGVKRIVYTSTILTYDFPRGGLVTEDYPHNYSSKEPYIHSKLLADEIMEQAVKEGMDIVFLHPTAMMGPYDRNYAQTWSKAFVDLQNKWLPFSPPNRTTFCYVKDVVRAHITAATKGRTGEHYILGGEHLNHQDLFSKIAELVGGHKPYTSIPKPIFRLYGRWHYYTSRLMGKTPSLTPSLADTMAMGLLCSSDKAIRELGYTITDHNVMLKECYDWLVSENIIRPKK